MKEDEAGEEPVERQDLVNCLDTLEEDFAKILEDTSSSSRDQLLKLQKAIPGLRQLIQEENDLRDAANLGRQSLLQTSNILDGIGSSTENAVNEIFEILQKIVYGDSNEGDTRDQLMKAMNVLQYQDIVAQQIKAIQAILTEMEIGLRGMMGGKVEEPGQASANVEGAFDPNARFDRDRAEVSQDDIDSWIKDSTGETDSDESIDQ